MKFLRKMKQSFIKRLEGLSFIEKSAERWNMKPRGAIYVYLSIIALVAGVSLFGYVIYLIVILCKEATGLNLAIWLILFILLELLISFGIYLTAFNIDNLLTGQENYVDYLFKKDQERFARRHHHYPE